MEQDSDFNSYASPQGLGQADETSPEVFRRAHIKHEADIKAVGSLYAFFGMIMALSLLTMGWQMVLGGYTKVTLVNGLWLSLAASLALALGVGLQTLASWVRIPAIVISALLGILSVVTIVGPFMHGYVIWLLLTQKGRKVMSPGYQKIVELTPDMKHPSSVRVVFLILMLVLFILSVLAVMMIPNPPQRRSARRDKEMITRERAK